MPVVDEDYVVPKSWDTFRSIYIQNGDTADWVHMILGAMQERIAVCLGSNWTRGANALQRFVGDYFEKFGRERVELYDFARRTEILLDKMLTPNQEWGTVDNCEHNPGAVDGFFVKPNPSQFMTRIDHQNVLGESETTLIPNYLTVRDVISQNGMNYKAALLNVARGDTIEKFVPFFSAVKRVLNYLTCIPCCAWYVNAGGGAYFDYYTSKSEIEADMTAEYNEDMQDAPDMSMLNSSSSLWLRNYTRLYRYWNQTDKYYGNFTWNNIFVQGIWNKWPNWNIDMYMGTYGQDVGGLAYDSYDYVWVNNRYYFACDKLGTTSGPSHWLRGDGSVLSKFPSGGPIYPGSVALHETSVAGYLVYIFFFADFNVQGGFRFRESS